MGSETFDHREERENEKYLKRSPGTKAQAKAAGL
jgi:hypothetical protein